MILKRFSWVYLVLFFPRPIASSSYLRNREERQKITLAREKRVCVLPTCVCVAPGWLPLFFLKKHNVFFFFFFSGFVFFELSKRFSEIDWKVFKTERQVRHVIWALQMESKHWHWPPHIPVESNRLFFCYFFMRIVCLDSFWRKKRKRERCCVYFGQDVGNKWRRTTAIYSTVKKKKKDQKIFLLFLPTIFFLLVVVIADDCETVG